MNLTQKPKLVGSPSITKTNDGMSIQQDDKIHLLNSTAAEIYELCNGEHSVRDIHQIIRSRYERCEGLETLIGFFLTQLQEAGLIEF